MPSRNVPLSLNSGTHSRKGQFSKRSPSVDPGVTLIEMLVVLTVIGLLAAILAPSAFRRPAYLVREQLVAELEQRFVRGASEARGSGQPVTVDLGRGIDAGKTAFVPAIGSASAPILYPDGSSNGGTVSLSGRPLIIIGWIDGSVHRAAG